VCVWKQITRNVKANYGKVGTPPRLSFPAFPSRGGQVNESLSCKVMNTRALPLAAGLKLSPRRRSSRRAVVERSSDTVVRAPVAPGISRTLGHRPSRMLSLRPQVRRDYPLSLSISISRGKETYKDSPSNGERTGKCPAWESGACGVRIVVWRSVLSGGPDPSPLERGAGEGESPGEKRQRRFFDEHGLDDGLSRPGRKIRAGDTLTKQRWFRHGGGSVGIGIFYYIE